MNHRDKSRALRAAGNADAWDMTFSPVLPIWSTLCSPRRAAMPLMPFSLSKSRGLFDCGLSRAGVSVAQKPLCPSLQGLCKNEQTRKSAIMALQARPRLSGTHHRLNFNAVNLDATAEELLFSSHAPSSITNISCVSCCRSPDSADIVQPRYSFSTYIFEGSLWDPHPRRRNLTSPRTSKQRYRLLVR